MRLQYFEPVDNPGCTRLYQVEFVLLLLNFIFISFACIITFRQRYHTNLKLIVVSLLSQYLVAVVCRIIICLCFIGMVKIDEPSNKNVLILVLSLIRMYFLYLTLFAPGSFFVERSLATYYLADYEKTRRCHISFGIIGISTITATICSVMFTYEIVSWRIIAFVTGTLSTFGGMGFWLVYRNNVALMKKFNRNSSANIIYSLSLRFQLNENIRTMKLIRNGCFIVGMIIMISGGLFIAAQIGRDRAHDIDKVLNWHYLELSFNISITIGALLLPILVIFTQKEWMLLVKRNKLIGWLFLWYRIPDEFENRDEPTIHFSVLTSRWESECLDRYKVRKRTKLPQMVIEYYERHKATVGHHSQSSNSQATNSSNEG